MLVANPSAPGAPALALGDMALAGVAIAAPGLGRSSRTSPVGAAVVDALVGGMAEAVAGSAKTAGKPSASAARRRAAASGAGYAKTSTPKTSTAKKTTSGTTKKTTTSTAKNGPLAFLDDPKMPVEEKLMRFLLYVNAQYEKDMNDKLKAARDNAAKSTKSSSSSSSSGGGTTRESGLLGTVAKALSTAVPGLGLVAEALQNKTVQQLVKTLSGPALAAGATALGLPEVAPALLKLGPSIADGAISLAKSVGAEDQASKSAATSSAATSSSASSTPQFSQSDILELQVAQEKQKEMFGLISNTLRAMHDTKMAVVNNIRA